MVTHALTEAAAVRPTTADAMTSSREASLRLSFQLCSYLNKRGLSAIFIDAYGVMRVAISFSALSPGLGIMLIT